jgi:hypothetical protein
MKSSNSQTQVSLHTRTDMRLSMRPPEKLSSVWESSVGGCLPRLPPVATTLSALPRVRVRDCCWDNFTSCFFVWIVRCASPAL